MKRSLSLTVEILLKLGTCLAACLGCSSKNPPAPDKPGTIHWKGQMGGYDGTTAIRPADNVSSTDKK